MNSGEKRLSDERDKGLSPSSGIALAFDSVEGLPEPTACSWGISGPELERLDNAIHILRRTRRPMAYLVRGDEILDKPEKEARLIDRKLKSDLVTYLKRNRRPAFWLEVLETGGGFHSNLIVPFYDGLDRLRANATYGPGLRGEKAIQTVYDWLELRNYLAGERTPQADFKHGKGLSRRTTGSHRFETKDGGDRVRVSDALELAMRAAGVWTDYQRSYAKPLAQTVTSALAKPLVEAQPGPAIRVEETGQLALDFAPDNVIQLAETKGRAKGLLQDDLARALFISRPTYANAKARRYRLSGWALARAAEYARAA